MQQQHEGGVRFRLSPDLQSVLESAREFARRYQHRCVEASDFVLALYYGSNGEVSQLLHLAVREQSRLDEAALKVESSGSAAASGELGESATRAFAAAAEGAVFFRGLSAPGEAIIHIADLAVALLKQPTVIALLKAAGLREFELRHLEEAIKFQQKMPTQVVSGSVAPTPGMRLQ